LIYPSKSIRTSKGIEKEDVKRKKQQMRVRHNHES